MAPKDNKSSKRKKGGSKKGSSSNEKPNTADLDPAAAALAGRAASAGLAVGVDRYGGFRVTTGRMCLCSACDPFGEGDAMNSDIATGAGPGVSYYFMFVKAMSWIFGIATICLAPNFMIVLQGKYDVTIGLSLLSQTMLGQLNNATFSLSDVVPLVESDNVTLTVLQQFGVTEHKLPALYSLIDLVVMVFISISVVYMIFFAQVLDSVQKEHSIGVEDFSIMIEGLKRCKCLSCLSDDGTPCGADGVGGCGLCGQPHITPEAIASHFERVASAFTKDYRVARVFGTPEVHVAAGDVRAITLFRKRSEMIRELKKTQALLITQEKALSLKPSDWTKRKPQYLRVLRAYSKHAKQYRATVQDKKIMGVIEDLEGEADDDDDDDDETSDEDEDDSDDDNDSDTSSANKRRLAKKEAKEARKAARLASKESEKSSSSTSNNAGGIMGLFTGLGISPSSSSSTTNADGNNGENKGKESSTSDIISGSISSFLSKPKSSSTTLIEHLSPDGKKEDSLDPKQFEAQRAAAEGHLGAADGEGFSDDDESDDDETDEETDRPSATAKATSKATRTKKAKGKRSKVSSDDEIHDSVGAAQTGVHEEDDNDNDDDDNFSDDEDDEEGDDDDDIEKDEEGENDDDDDDDDDHSDDDDDESNDKEDDTESNKSGEDDAEDAIIVSKEELRRIEPVPEPEPPSEEQLIPPLPPSTRMETYTRKLNWRLFPMKWLCLSSFEKKEWRVVRSRAKIDDLLHDIESASARITRFVTPEALDAEFELKKKEEKGEKVDLIALALQREKIVAEAESEKVSYRPILEDPVAAFVTFQSAATAKAIIQLYSMGSLEWTIRQGEALVNAPPPMPLPPHSIDGDDDNGPTDLTSIVVVAANESKENSSTSMFTRATSSFFPRKTLTSAASVPDWPTKSSHSKHDKITSSSTGKAKDSTKREKVAEKKANVDEDCDDNSDSEEDEEKNEKSKKKREEKKTNHSLVVLPLSFLGQHITVKAPPPPDTVLWENLHVSKTERFIRQSISCGLAVLLILVSFAVLYGGEILRATGNATTIAEPPDSDICLASTSMVTYNGVIYSSVDPYVAFNLDLVGLKAATEKESIANNSIYNLVSLSGSMSGLISINASAYMLSLVPVYYSSLVALNQTMITSTTSYPNTTINSTNIINRTLCPPLSGSDIFAFNMGVPYNQSFYLPWKAVQDGSCGIYSNSSSALAQYLTLSSSNGTNSINTSQILPIVKAIRNNYSSSERILVPVTPSMRSCFCQRVMVTNPALFAVSPSEIFDAVKKVFAKGLPTSFGGYQNGVVIKGALATNISYTIDGVIRRTTSYDTAPSHAPEIEVCLEILAGYLAYTILVGFAGVIIVFSNTMSSYIISYTAPFDKNPTAEDEKIAIFIRSLALNFFNTGVLSLLVSAYVPQLPITTPGAKYPDFTNDWYIGRGSAMALTMILQAILPAVFKLFQICWWRSYKVIARIKVLCKCCCTQMTQADLVKVFTGPEFDEPGNYAQHLTVIFVCLMYGLGIPILFFIAFINFALSYVIDLWMFLFFNSRPPKLNASLGRVAVMSLPFAIILHLLLGSWMLSTDGIYAISRGETIGSYGNSPLVSQYLSWIKRSTSNPTAAPNCTAVWQLQNKTTCDINSAQSKAWALANGYNVSWNNVYGRFVNYTDTLCDFGPVATVKNFTCDGVITSTLPTLPTDSYNTSWVRGVNDTLGVYIQTNETLCVYYNETSSLNVSVPVGFENSTCTNITTPSWFNSNCTTCIEIPISEWYTAPCVNVTSLINVTGCVQPCSAKFTNKPCLSNNTISGTLSSSSSSRRMLQVLSPAASSILPTLPSISTSVKTITQNFVTSDLGVVIAERFNLKYILPLGVFALLWTIIIVLGFLTVWFFRPILRFLISLVSIPVKIVLYLEMSCWNPKTGCLWRLATCCGCQKSLKKRTKKPSETEKSGDNADNEGDDASEQVERITKPEDDIRALSDIGGGDLEGFLPPVTWASVVAAKHIQTGRVPPIADVIQSLLNSQGGISGGFNSDDELGKELAKEAAKMDAEERAKRNASCGLCVMRTFCCFCLCAHHAFCGKRTPSKASTKKETPAAATSKGKKKEDEKKKSSFAWLWGGSGTNSSKASKSKKKDKESGKTKNNEETGIELTKPSSWSVSFPWGGKKEGAKDGKGKDATPPSKSKSKADLAIENELKKAELIRNELKRGFFCCGGNIRCGRLRGVRPGTESEDGRRVLIGIPDFNTAFALRMLSGVPTYNILSSPRVLAAVFPDHPNPGQLSKRYNTLAEATLFTDIDLAGEDKLASEVGGWESTKDIGTGTNLDGSTFTAHTTIEGEDTDDEGDDVTGKGKEASKKSTRKGRKDSDDGIEMTSVKDKKK
jgi:hypothetical protein